MTMIRNTSATDIATIAAVCGTRVFLEAGYCPGFQMRVGAEVLRTLSRSNPMWWEDVTDVLPEIEKAVKALPNFEDHEALWAWLNTLPKPVKRKLCALWGFQGAETILGRNGMFRHRVRMESIRTRGENLGSSLDSFIYRSLMEAVYLEEGRSEAYADAIPMAAAMVALAKAGAPTAFVLGEVRKNLDWNWGRWVERENIRFEAGRFGVRVVHRGGSFYLRERNGGRLANVEDVRILRRWLETNGLLQQAAA